MRVSLALIAFLMACGADDDGGDESGGDDGGDDSGIADGSPGGSDAGADGGADAGAGCARELLAGVDLGAPDRLIADDAALYLAAYSKTEHRLWRIGREDGEVQQLATFAEIYRVASLTSDADALYFSGDVLAEPTPVPPVRGLFRVPKTGGGEPEPISSDTATGLAVDATHIYWLSRDAFDRFAIKRRAKAGGTEEILAEGDDTGLGPRFALAGDHVYWDQGIELRRAPAAGGASEIFGYLAPRDRPDPCSSCLVQLVAADDGQLYWFQLESEATRFYRTETDAFEAELLVTDPPYSATGGAPFLVYDGQIYWSTLDAGIRRAPAAGGESIGVKERNAPAFVPTLAGLFTVNWLDVVRLSPLEGCPE